MTPVITLGIGQRERGVGERALIAPGLDDDDSGPQRRCTHPGITRSGVEAAK
ncbi:hypothetical protein [Streptomyces sp. NPDC058424]|uniref:hypothetical protein n=1 Tax=Streptomyces sp. NPDC058424 TaxID=3346491 RepID=UPI00364B735A